MPQRTDEYFKSPRTPYNYKSRSYNNRSNTGFGDDLDDDDDDEEKGINVQNNAPKLLDVPIKSAWEDVDDSDDEYDRAANLKIDNNASRRQKTIRLGVGRSSRNRNMNRMSKKGSRSLSPTSPLTNQPLVLSMPSRFLSMDRSGNINDSDYEVGVDRNQNQNQIYMDDEKKEEDNDDNTENVKVIKRKPRTEATISIGGNVYSPVSQNDYEDETELTEETDNNYTSDDKLKSTRL
eukprot:CAMPEP_0201596580 /NCGR_PEP_ID=MMETSP0190_2-20130828/193233_1 /ASSEMBLY_ACC=CAM_ASM_000263 /TAXON_ID=37353 /ORGANISM="Rosalina sp." /LENGTH=234 /DNA_ID=CAMNT_0048057009 /DNA_START=1071 /DNA_END=1775 /DNA_ORIENTATION=+